jgi:hypothetical protein
MLAFKWGILASKDWTVRKARTNPLAYFELKENKGIEGQHLGPKL